MNEKKLNEVLKIANFWKRITPKNNALYNDPHSKDLIRDDLHMLSKAVLELTQQLEEVKDKLQAYDVALDAVVVKSMREDLH